MVPTTDGQSGRGRRIASLPDVGVAQTQSQSRTLKPIVGAVRMPLPALKQQPKSTTEQSAPTPAVRLPSLPTASKRTVLPPTAVPTSQRPVPIGAAPAAVRTVDHLKPSVALSNVRFHPPSPTSTGNPLQLQRSQPTKATAGESKRVIPEGKVTQSRGFLLVSEL